MDVDLARLFAWVTALFFPLVRIGACLMVAPVFGAHYVPARVRLLLALGLTVMVAPILPDTAPIEPLSGAGAAAVAQQLLIGAAAGFVLQLLFDALALGGQLISNGMGLGFAFNLDPLRGVSTPALGQLYVLLGTLVFLALDGHVALIDWLVQSFRLLPVGGEGLGSVQLLALAQWGGHLFAGALQIALPAMTALLVVNLAFGAMSRAAPALNLFAIGLPVTLCFGLVVLLFSLPTLRTAFTHQLAEGFALLRAWPGN